MAVAGADPATYADNSPLAARKQIVTKQLAQNVEAYRMKFSLRKKMRGNGNHLLAESTIESASIQYLRRARRERGVKEPNTAGQFDKSDDS